MKYYIVYFLDHKNNNNVTITELYKSKDDAINSVENVAIKHIKKLQGKQQVEICKQGKTLDEIKFNQDIKEGLYILQNGEKTILYEKVILKNQGYVWNSAQTVVNEIGMFWITEYNFDEALFKCNCAKIPPPPKPQIPKNETNVPNKPVAQGFLFLDQLRNLHQNGGPKLKPIIVNEHKKPVIKETIVTIDEKEQQLNYDDMAPKVSYNLAYFNREKEEFEEFVITQSKEIMESIENIYQVSLPSLEILIDKNLCDDIDKLSVNI